MPSTAVFVWISPPASRRSSASARATAAKSTIAVAGECSAAIPAACGSISRRAAASSAPQARDAVGGAATLELVERRQLGAVERDDQLAAALVREPARLAVAGQLARARDAEPGLERTGRVVDPGVHDARVAACLVRGDALLLLEHDHVPARIAQGELARDRQPDDAGADDRDLRLGHEPQTMARARG